MHQAPTGYPGTGDPRRRGLGNVVNATVPPGAARETWRAAFESLMAPLDAFAPDLILISAGFDAHARDPLADQALEAEDFAWATRAIAIGRAGAQRAAVLSPRLRAATTLKRSASRPWRMCGRLQRGDGRREPGCTRSHRR